MNTRVRTTLQTMKTSAKHEKEKSEMQGSKVGNAQKAMNRRSSSRERKMALQQDVDKLRKKLRHEENVHRALERAFTRPLGALPRLPPYLPPNTLELLAEVAVLEEEVIRLEEQLVNFRQGLYQEAVYIASSKKSIESTIDSYDLNSNKSSKAEHTKPSSHVADLESIMDGRGKENQSCTKATMPKNRQLSQQKATITKTSARRRSLGSKSMERLPNPLKLQHVCQPIDQVRVEGSTPSIISRTLLDDGTSGPNKLSEDVLKCLSSIFLRMSELKVTGTDLDMLPSISWSSSCECPEEMEFQDPYSICSEFGRRDIGPYKHLHAIEGSLIDTGRVTSSSFLMRRLKILLGKLASADLRNLTHQQKLAFWINIYNACMMNAFLEHGIPGSPQMVVALMQKAMINVGGHLLNAMTIEHFILRMPYQSKSTHPRGIKNDEVTIRSIFGLDWPEPLVTFALSCGSWSSPAVRVYTASEVENQLQVAKRDYLQASVGISTTKLAIPKLLDWYLLDFAKDLESLLDWICLQLPCEVRKEALKCLERGRQETMLATIQVIPYEFSFRYLLAP